MKIQKTILYIGLIVCLCTNICGQNSKVPDSLYSVIKTAKHDTLRVKAYSALCDFFKNSNPDTSMYFAKQGLFFATKINYRKGISACYNNIGNIYQYQGSYDKAIEYYLMSLKIKEELCDKNGMSASYNKIGLVHYNQGLYDKALEFYFKALKIIEESGDKTGMSACYINIGMVHHSQGIYDKVLEYFFKALKIKEELGDKKGMSLCYNNIGGVHHSLKHYDKALEYYSKSLRIFEESGDKKRMSSCYSNIGLVYSDQGLYDNALMYYLKSLKIFEEIGDKEGLVVFYNNIGSLNITIADSVTLNDNQRLHYMNKAIEYGTKAILLAKEINAMPRENEAASTLMIAYKKLGNFKKAIEYAEIFIATKDSMFSEDKTKALAKMQAQYEAEKRELTIQKLEKEKLLQNETIARKNEESKKQKILIFSFLAGFIIILVFSVFLYRLFLQKKKANVIIVRKNQSLEIAYSEINAQKEEITAQRDEIEAQRDKLSEQNHILAEQKKEITDSINYAKRIQQAILPDISLALSKGEGESPSLWGRLGGVFILFKPKDIVSGDFYWATRINQWLIVTVADCTGHGVPGAFMSMLGVSFLNEIVRKKEITKASEVLDHLRESIIEALQQKGDMGEQKDGMDIALVAINTTTCTDAINRVSTYNLQFAGANNPLYIVKKVSSLGEAKPLEEIKGDKQPVGIHEKMTPFTNHEIKLNKGDTLYLCSDGYEDQFGGDKYKKFMSKRLMELFVTISDKPMNEQWDILDTTFENWKGANEQIDDVTVLGIKI